MPAGDNQGQRRAQENDFRHFAERGNRGAAQDRRRWAWATPRDIPLGQYHDFLLALC
jgi:hypothetical protein